jgi:cellulose synthase/poly-beta-1,6-N-acetylglucosamine synthase-like glycosyltransferase
VVAARNEEKLIIPLLESLSRQDYPADLLEIIIVNDNSTDRTPIVVSEFTEKLKKQSALNIRLIFNPFPGKKRAIRYGIEKASGELILTTDADCVVGPGWVNAHARAYGYCRVSVQAGVEGMGSVSAQAGAYTSGGENTHTAAAGAGSADMILGEVYHGPGKSFTSRFGMFEFSALQAITEAAVVAGHPVMCNAANMSFRRDVYLRHTVEMRDGLPSGDDIFLMHAIKRAGGTIGYAGSSAAAVETATAVTAAALLRQRARWASKAYWYSDAATLTLAAATAACNAAVTAAAVASIISVAHLPLLAAMYGLRLVPDYLIIARNIKKRGERIPVIQFLASELIYPFYFMTVAILSIFPASRRFGKR